MIIRRLNIMPEIDICPLLTEELLFDAVLNR